MTIFLFFFTKLFKSFTRLFNHFSLSFPFPSTIFDEPILNSVNEYSVDGVNIKINKTNDVNQLLKLESKSIIAVLDGGFESDDNQLVLSPGDIVGLETIKKLAEVFKIQKYITYLTI